MKQELEQLRQEFNERIDALLKPKFELNKWYKDLENKALYCIAEFNGIGENGKNYGFDYNGDWMELGNRVFDKDTTKEVRLATPTEVQEALEKEAVKRGFKEGVKFKVLDVETIFTFKKIWFSKNNLNMAWSSDCGIIFNNGTWATPIKTMTIDELASDIKLSIHLNNTKSLEYNIFKYLTENKSQIIETLNNL